MAIALHGRNTPADPQVAEFMAGDQLLDVSKFPFHEIWYLSELDSACGDGDHGTTMRQAMNFLEPGFADTGPKSSHDRENNGMLDL